MLNNLATFLHAHGRRVLLVAVIGAAIAGVFGIGVTSKLSPYGANDPATQSVQAMSRFEAAAGRQIDPGIVALVAAGDLRTAAAQARVRRVETMLRGGPDIVAVRSYYDTHDPAMVSRDGRSTYVLAYFKPRSDTALKNDAQTIENRFAGQRDVKLGGLALTNAQANTQVSNDLAHAELLAFPFIFLLSLLFFRSLVASLLPPLLGGLAILATFFALRIVASFVDLSVFALNLVTGLGLGLAIDYSLFMVSRYREEAAVSGFGLNAIRRTLETSGRTILFSSLTVAAAIASLAIFPQRFLYSMGIAGALVALIAGALALTVLPALLTVLGPRVNALSPKRLQRAADRDASREQSGFWYRLSRFVMRRPAPIAAMSAAVLITLGIPFASIKFLPVSASVLPASASAHQVDVTLWTQFPPGRTAPLEVVVGAPVASPQVRALAARLDALPDVSAIAPAIPAGPKLSMVAVAPATPPFSARTQQLVHAVRIAPRAVLCRRHRPDRRLRRPRAEPREPPAAGPCRGGAVDADRAVPDDRLGRAAGQGGADERARSERGVRDPGADLPARQPPGPALLPVGRRARRDPADPAVRDRLRASDRLRCVPAVADQRGARQWCIGFRSGRRRARADRTHRHRGGSPVRSRDRCVRYVQARVHKGAGVGTALVVLIDASIIRALLVPSLMELLGSWNWWAPKPLRRLYDRIGLHENGSPPPRTAEPLPANPPDGRSPLPPRASEAR